MPGKIITVAQSKGGAGKSTVAVNFAIDSAKDGYNVLLCDTEKSGTTLDYQSRDDDSLTIIDGYDKQFPKMLDVYRNSFDLIIIDTAGANVDIDGDGENFQETLNHKILSKTDLLVIPVEPSPVAIRKSYRFFQSIEKYIDMARGNLDALVVVNKYSTKTKLSKELISDLPDITDIKISENRIRLAEVVKRAEMDLKSVNEIAPGENVAVDLRRLRKEVLEMANKEA
ncbi:AAA family ATPase [Enterovibrio norvegicus]|uniref:AAA family ATPase n=1 Tax=Enterovibrio norvegicus TaxID=188144 RepID=A0ABV4L581_9GAMM